MYIPPDEYSLILKRMPILCVDLLILHDNKCLLLLRNNEPAKGQYWFPGGRVFKNESLSAAALRIGKAETNLVCSFQRFVSVEETFFPRSGDMKFDIHTVNICCALSPTNIQAIEVDSFHSGFIWVDKALDDLHEGVRNPLKKIGF